ncbi:MAG: hypothetical protein R6U38_05620 [Desulfatiglandaceae bacterium]
MDQIAKVLISRLIKKGLAVDQIPGLIRDVKNSLNDNGDINAFMVNQKLAYLGWEEGMVDEYIFHLILPVLNQKGSEGMPAWKMDPVLLEKNRFPLWSARKEAIGAENEW